MNCRLSLWVVEINCPRQKPVFYIFDTKDETEQFIGSKFILNLLKEHPETVVMFWDLYGQNESIDKFSI